MFDSFAALIFVTDTERDAVLQMLPWEELRMPGDGQLYYHATLQRDGQTCHLYGAQQDEMGMTAAATLSMKLIWHFHPGYLIMPGIAAGTGDPEKDEQIFGDVLLANAVWNYSNGKYVEPEGADIRFGTVGFLPRPTIVRIDEAVLPYLRAAIDHPENENCVHLGYLASGSTIVANSEIVEKQIHQQFENTKGLEMEAYGVAYVAQHAVEPRPYAIIAKSICDFANSRKDDKYQQFAAYTSCEFCSLLCEKILPIR